MLPAMKEQKRTIVFLRMAVIELRRLAEISPEISENLLFLAQQLEAEADDLTAVDGC
jgi:hypothetical protein